MVTAAPSPSVGLVGESVPEARHTGRRFELNWQDAESVGELATLIISEAVAGFGSTSGEPPQVLVVTTPTSASETAIRVVPESLVRRYPRSRVELMPALVAAAESWVRTSSLALGDSLVVACLRDGPPDGGIVTRTATGCQLSGGRFAGQVDLARLVLAEVNQELPVLIVGTATAVPDAVETVLRRIAPTRISRLGNDAIVLGAARWGVERAHLLDRIPVDAPAPLDDSAVIDDDVQFTVYRPRSVRPERCEKLLAFAHLTNETRDEDGYLFDPVERVHLEAAAVLAGKADQFVAVARDSDVGLPRGSALRFVPDYRASGLSHRCGISVGSKPSTARNSRSGPPATSTVGRRGGANLCAH